MNQKIQSLKGFRDFLPDDTRKRNWLKNKLIEYSEAWGYEPLETPTLEPLELFAGEIGEDEKLFFSFTDRGGRKVALRYDQTVPTCRVIGEYFDKLTFPFRRYQIQSAYRAEKPQRGRYREFTQFDVDIFGIASPLADAEVIALNLDTYTKLGFDNVIIKVNNRDLFINFPYKALTAIDKLVKIGEDGVIEDMVRNGIELADAKKFLSSAQKIQQDETINIIFKYLKDYGFDKSQYEFAPTLARSFFYSQGPIWEIYIPSYGAGSVGGGERYDNLVKNITGRDIPGTGIGYGFDRTLEALEESGLLPKEFAKSSVLIIPLSTNVFTQAIKASNLLRKANISCELFPDPTLKIDKQLKYADQKKVPYVIILGEEEEAKGVVKLKNMKTQEQEDIAIQAAIEKLTRDTK